jgi:hypothetical protein
VQILQMPLFDDAGVLDPESVPFRKTRPVPPSWTLSDHACRFCFGRVLQRKVKGQVEVRCAECCKAAQSGPMGICCCGADCGALGRALECFRNPNITEANRQEIMVRERVDIDEETRLQPKRLRINPY